MINNEDYFSLLKAIQLMEKSKQYLFYALSRMTPANENYAIFELHLKNLAKLIEESEKSLAQLSQHCAPMA